MERLSIWLALAIVGVFAASAMLFSRLHPTAPTRTVRSMNVLFIIMPYKHYGLWVFDDPAVGLSKEPFIAGIDTMIDKVVADIPRAERGFRAIFSARPFPESQFKLEWRREGSGGNWYYS